MSEVSAASGASGAVGRGCIGGGRESERRVRDVSPRIHVYSRREMAEAEAKAPHICMRMAERKRERENRREKKGGRGRE